MNFIVSKCEQIDILNKNERVGMLKVNKTEKTGITSCFFFENTLELWNVMLEKDREAARNKKSIDFGGFGHEHENLENS